MENRITISVFGHIIIDDYDFNLKEDQCIEYKDNITEVRKFIWEYWKKKDDTREILDIIKKINITFDNIKPNFMKKEIKKKNIGVQTQLDLF